MKIGILFGRENSFPEGFIQRVNEKAVQGITAEPVKINGTRLNDAIPYSVIVDRMSHEVPYYRAYLKKAVADGVIVINNPFWWSADDKFFECVLSERLGVAVPRTVVLPNKSYEADIIDESLRNFAGPIPWEEFVDYCGGFPLVLKPAVGGGWKNVTIAQSMDELVGAYEGSGHLLMIMQEFIHYENYVRCFVVGRKDVLISGYEPTRGHFERYRLNETRLTPELHDRVVEDCLTLNKALGYDMNTVEFAIRDGVPHAIDFLNPAPDFGVESIKQDYYEWVVEAMANLVIDYALGAQVPIGSTSPPGDLRWQTMINAVPALPA